MKGPPDSQGEEEIKGNNETFGEEEVKVEKGPPKVSMKEPNPKVKRRPKRKGSVCQSVIKKYLNEIKADR